VLVTSDAHIFPSPFESVQTRLGRAPLVHESTAKLDVIFQHEEALRMHAKESVKSRDVPFPSQLAQDGAFGCDDDATHLPVVEARHSEEPGLDVR